MKVLVTGFEPFGGEKINPSYQGVEMLEDNIDGGEIIKATLPVVFKKSSVELEKLIELHKPDIVICVGQGGGRYGLSIERVAINIDDAVIPDNEGNKPIDERIREDGENAYFSNLPIKKIVDAIKKANIPAEISNTAGTYVCNHLMYNLLYIINKKYPEIRGGFIHVPFLPEQVLSKANTPYMTLEMITKGLTLAISAVIKDKR
ncbi:pyroglutamyl-peptidase [Anaerobranca californiensis DSM 14826]|jgi:pyroglutamyl-peptidase|uniref:Pyrrolidone-carboxylate peptidase n=1 Tax=Anaerobranca californiensis DSM 14826 TaxID=1120989 RepID=A0A1M6S2K2_9FIRM|nr:pyroglutamyl-peptidase I [Anaerobranca californiensis]SHK38901.1 pyroglutamyl-peptidase [Anaerobranca californiensis DSM 14826]